MPKYDFHVVFDASGTKPRVTKRSPGLSRSEVAVRIRATIPDGVFQSMVPEAELRIPDSAIIRPAVELEVVEPPPDDLESA